MTVRNAPPFAESLDRVEAKAVPISDDLKFNTLFHRILRPAYVRFLESTKKEPTK